jgi:hypothetical protein
MLAVGKSPARLALGALALLGALGCQSTPAVPLNPAWADVAPIFRGECNSCHGWNSNNTGNGYRFDFFDRDMLKNNCGDADAVFEDPNSPFKNQFLTSTAIKQIGDDIVAHAGAEWPRMPPQPSPALADWEKNTLLLWTADAVQGAPPLNNRPPAISVYGLPMKADTQLEFTTVLQDPDGDSAIGIIKTPFLKLLMGRTGSFDVNFDTSQWPAGSTPIQAVLCDGWISSTIDLGSVQIAH